MNQIDKNQGHSTQTSAQLFASSSRPLMVDRATAVEDYCTNFCQANARWETIGLFLVAVGRAITDIPFFDNFYENEEQRRNLRRRAVYLSDRCLESALSLDCLNDLQLMLQYENFIARSFVDGNYSTSKFLFLLLYSFLPFADG